MDQNIVKVGPGRFEVYWTVAGREIPDTRIHLDFNPLIRHSALKRGDAFVIMHWQDKPKGVRRFGAYDGRTDSYYSSANPGIHGVVPTAFQLDENSVSTSPTAVLLFLNAIATKPAQDLFVIQAG